MVVALDVVGVEEVIFLTPLVVVGYMVVVVLVVVDLVGLEDDMDRLVVGMMVVVFLVVDG